MGIVLFTWQPHTLLVFLYHQDTDVIKQLLFHNMMHPQQNEKEVEDYSEQKQSLHELRDCLVILKALTHSCIHITTWFLVITMHSVNVSVSIDWE